MAEDRLWLSAMFRLALTLIALWVILLTALVLALCGVLPDLMFTVVAVSAVILGAGGPFAFAEMVETGYFRYVRHALGRRNR